MRALLSDFVHHALGFWIVDYEVDGDLLGDDGVSNVSHPRITPKIDVMKYPENDENSA